MNRFRSTDVVRETSPWLVQMRGIFAGGHATTAPHVCIWEAWKKHICLTESSSDSSDVLWMSHVLSWFNICVFPIHLVVRRGLALNHPLYWWS